MKPCDFCNLKKRDRQTYVVYYRKKNDPTQQQHFAFGYLNNKGEIEIDGRDIEGHTDEPVNFCPNCRRDLNDED